MKMKKKTLKPLVSMALVLLLAFVALGCDNSEQKTGKATAYGVTGECPVSVEMEVDGDGKVLDVKIDEYLSVRDIGALTYSSGEYNKCGIIIDYREGRQAKKVRVGKNVFEFTGDEYVCDGVSAADYVSHNGAQYVYELKTGNFDLVGVDGEDYGVKFDRYDGCRTKKTEWANKMKNGYHEGVEYNDGWKEDMYNLAQHLKNHGFNGYTGEERAGKSGTFKVGGYDTLVSQSNFHDYMRLARRAYDMANQKVK